VPAAAEAPTNRPISARSGVALAVDRPGMPPRSLLVRGSATIEIAAAHGDPR
jgi:hypothetical protein